MLLSVFNGLLCASVIWGIMAYLASQVNYARLRARSDIKNSQQLLHAPIGVEKYCETLDGARLRTIHRGSGPAVILVHSPGFSVESLTPLWEQLARIGFRLICFDLRGHGASSAGTQKLNREVLANDLTFILEHFNIKEGILVGHGMGASIAIQAMRKNPDTLRKYLKGFVSLAGFEGDKLFLSSHSRFMRGLVKGVLFKKILSNNTLATWFSSNFWGPEASYEQIQAGLSIFDIDNFRKFLQTSEVENVSDEKIDIPTLLIQGKEDQILPDHSYANKLSKKFVQAEVAWLETAGYMLQAEKSQVIANLINNLERG